MIVYLNGHYVPQDVAKVPVSDRGFLFADGVYEVIPVYNGRPFHLSAHLKRLQQSLTAIRIDNPLEDIGWVNRIRAVIEKNECRDCALYLQVTRGSDSKPRDHAFPAKARPTVLIMLQPLKPVPDAVLREGVKAVLLDDIRWLRCDVKSVALLGNVLLRQAAIDLGATEALLQRNGHLTEGAASNIFVVQAGEVLTPPIGRELLSGITRDLVLAIARDIGFSVRETAIPVTMLKKADEIWMTSSTKGVLPITRLDGNPVGEGSPGRVWQEVHQGYREMVEKFARPPARANS